METLAGAADLFALFAEPTRVRLLRLLGEGMFILCSFHRNVKNYLTRMAGRAKPVRRRRAQTRQGA